MDEVALHMQTLCSFQLEYQSFGNVSNVMPHHFQILHPPKAKRRPFIGDKHETRRHGGCFFGLLVGL
ncbi:hypothetical protein ACIQZI_04960 [Peribacillus sp. NPDC096379]|uniref:hypothetical protein n=1 Tax=Peribacillus sp. NPDC096379 TaxID=3364393 RepID=UPI0037FCF75B